MYDAVAEAAAPKVKDDRDHDVIETTERYTISLDGLEDNEPLHWLPIYPDLMRGFFSRLPAQVHHPYPLNVAFDQRDIVTVDAPTLGLYAIRNGAVSSPYFTFLRRVDARPGHIEVDYCLHFLADSVPAGEFVIAATSSGWTTIFTPGSTSIAISTIGTTGIFRRWRAQ